MIPGELLPEVEAVAVVSLTMLSFAESEGEIVNVIFRLVNFNYHCMFSIHR